MNLLDSLEESLEYIALQAIICEWSKIIFCGRKTYLIGFEN